MLRRINYLAKPNGITLKEHTDNLYALAIEYIQNRQFLLNKYNRFFDINLIPKLFNVILKHDDGKAFPAWQEACKKDYELKKQGQKLKYLLKSGVRHEFYSILMNPDLDKYEIIAIAAHHSKLRDYSKPEFIAKMKQHDYDGKNYYDTYKSLLNINEKISESRSPILSAYEYNALRSILQIIDKFASFLEEEKNKDKKEQLEFKNFNWEFTHHSYRRIQELIKENFNTIKDVTFIKGVTGSGKTQAAYLWAKNIINNKLADRLIFTLPTTFQVDGIFNDIEEYNSGKVHSKVKLEDALTNNIILFKNKVFENPITITTIDQILNNLARKREAHFIGLNNIFNSCIVIDEIDSYDEYVLNNIRILIKNLIKCGVKFLIMSATITDEIADFLCDKSIERTKIIRDNSNDNVEKVKINSIKNYNILSENRNEELNFILKKIKKYGKTIVYCNTVNSCVRFNLWLQENNIKSICYHSDFLPLDSLERKNTIINNFGKNAISNDYNVCVMTQIGERSLNISADYMVSEICPFDILVQRLGRLNRFDNTIVGELDILIPRNDKLNYYYPYVNFETNDVNKYLELTLNHIYGLENKTLKYSELDYYVNLIYKNFSYENIENYVKDNGNEYEKLITNNIILYPDRKYDDENDESDYGFWKTRDFQATIQIIINDFNNVKKINVDRNGNEVFLLKKSEYNRLLNVYSINKMSYFVNEKNPTRFSTINISVHNDDVEINNINDLIGGRKTGKINDYKITVLSDINDYNKNTGFDISLYSGQQDSVFI
ncbi:MAG: CRISPR-associated helicase Cas3' [bacterium]